MKKRLVRGAESDGGRGHRIVVGGRSHALHKHPTDFTVLGPRETLKRTLDDHGTDHRGLGRSQRRVSAGREADRDRQMAEIRSDYVVHHVYVVEGTGQDVVVTDRIYLRLVSDDPRVIGRLCHHHHLRVIRRIGGTYVLELTAETGSNPVKLASYLSTSRAVLECTPEIVMHPRRQQLAHEGRQWYLDGPPGNPSAGIGASAARALVTPSANVVVAVIDDGFDLGHPSLRGAPLHPRALSLVSDGRVPPVSPDSDDFHGTSVASLAVAHGPDSAMRGVAGGCTFLPIRINTVGLRPEELLRALIHASEHADVANISLGFRPLTAELKSTFFTTTIADILRRGGRNRRGMPIVVCSGNDGAPTLLPGSENHNGVRYFFKGEPVPVVIGAGRDVSLDFLHIPGLIVVGSMTSTMRRAGYSNWGKHLTVAAPSSNGHELEEISPFNVTYPGDPVLAAINRPGHGDANLDPLTDPPGTGAEDARAYSGAFGGTSAAAPIVTGTVALMLSANPALTAGQVNRILANCAVMKGLDHTPDCTNDPNLQSKSFGPVKDGTGRRHSEFFGYGRVDAAASVKSARAQVDVSGAPPADGVRSNVDNLPKLMNAPQTYAHDLAISGAGRVFAVRVRVDIDQSMSTRFRLALEAPDGKQYPLTEVGDNFLSLGGPLIFEDTDTASLRELMNATTEGRGVWKLIVTVTEDLVNVGLNSWSLDLREPVSII